MEIGCGKANIHVDTCSEVLARDKMIMWTLYKQINKLRNFQGKPTIFYQLFLVSLCVTERDREENKLKSGAGD